MDSSILTIVIKLLNHPSLRSLEKQSSGLLNGRPLDCCTSFAKTVFTGIFLKMTKVRHVTCFLLWFSVAVGAHPISQLVIFGDSLSDSGNSYEYTHHQKPPSPIYYQGRYSNGPIWVDYVRDQLTSHPVLLNYAFGGAGVLQSQPNAFTLSQEVDSYLLAHQTPPESNSWFVMWIGANDYLLHPDATPATANKVVTEIERNALRLAQHGAQHIIILALPALGRSPFAQDLDLQIQLSAISEKHNYLLKDRVAQLQTKFPKIDWQYRDVNQVLVHLVSHPKQYGMTHIAKRCLEPGTGHHKVDCSGYVFFDQFHPTTQVHKLFAQRFILDTNR
ncbi:MAG: SGNH/GDSL hydrolase family protein [Legionellales bacterium]|nr:SGNH/GDSL hydrolase family protein [Legionellales bacterium]